jgi:hypothetical protein
MWNTVGADTGILSSLRQYGISIFLQSQKPYTMKKQKKKEKKKKRSYISNTSKVTFCTALCVDVKRAT